jgi:hypothetical protein
VARAGSISRCNHFGPSERRPDPVFGTGRASSTVRESVKPGLTNGESAGSCPPAARSTDLVNEACGLTPDELRLMWATAPPRMPLNRGA